MQVLIASGVCAKSIKTFASLGNFFASCNLPLTFFISPKQLEIFFWESPTNSQTLIAINKFFF